MTNEKTSARVAAIAGKILRQVPMGGTITVNFIHAQYGPAVLNIRGITWSDIRALAASALTQTADKERRYNPDVPQPWVDQPDGFDPRDGSSGEPERAWRPKSKQVRAALRGQLGRQPGKSARTATKASRVVSGSIRQPKAPHGQMRVTSARIKSANSRPWPPSAKPPRRGP